MVTTVTTSVLLNTSGDGPSSNFVVSCQIRHQLTLGCGTKQSHSPDVAAMTTNQPGPSKQPAKVSGGQSTSQGGKAVNNPIGTDVKTVQKQGSSMDSNKPSAKTRFQRALQRMSFSRPNRTLQSQSKTAFSHKRAIKTVKLVVLLSGTFLAMQLPPFIGRLAIALSCKPKPDENFGVISERMIGDITTTTFIMRWIDIIPAGFYPCINPLILMRLDKEYKLFRKHAFCTKNKVKGF